MNAIAITGWRRTPPSERRLQLSFLRSCPRTQWSWGDTTNGWNRRKPRRCGAPDQNRPPDVLSPHDRRDREVEESLFAPISERVAPAGPTQREYRLSFKKNPDGREWGTNSQAKTGRRKKADKGGRPLDREAVVGSRLTANLSRRGGGYLSVAPTSSLSKL